MAGYTGITLARGAQTSSRRALGRTLLFIAVYSVVLAVFYSLPETGRSDALPIIALCLAGFSTIELFGFATWYARGAQPDAKARLPTPLRAGFFLAYLAMVALAFTRGANPLSVLSPWAGLVFLGFVVALGACSALSVAWIRGVPGARGYLFAALLPSIAIVLNVLEVLGVRIPSELFRPVRDLALILYEFLIITSYLDDGHEPMSLRNRLVSGSLMATLALTLACGHLLLPFVAPLATHVAALRLIAAACVSTLLVITLAPRIFRQSLIEPLNQLTDAISKAETGERVELATARKDELGRVARSFNRMVGSLADGRAKLAAQVLALEDQQLEIETLNEELRRQVAARSRHLAQVLPQLERFEGTIHIGAVVDGRYRVEEHLGAGAMGIVFGIRRVSDQKQLALKTMIGGSQEDAVRFTREAEIAATIDHPNIVTVMDVGMHQGIPYFVMERLGGGSLANASARFSDLRWVLPVLRQIASGLEDLDARGILHRDIKPANILLDGEPNNPIAKIADLGIARQDLADGLARTAEAGAMSVGDTAPTALVGTFPYMAPELSQGAHAYTSAAEVFSFAVLAWEVCTGSLPFRLPPVFAVLSGEPLAEPLARFATSHEVEALLRRCLSQNVDSRPTIGEIAEVLESFAPTAENERGAVGA
jgi:hypothetical protein